MYLLGGYTFVLLIPPLLLALYAQQKVRSTYKHFSTKLASSRIPASQVAQRILNSSGVRDVKIEKAAGQLTDHYHPRKKILRLSQGVYGSSSLAAMGIAAHEAGHAIQHNSGYAPLHLRNAIYPVASFGSSLAFPLFFVGFIFRQGPSILMDIGILLFAGAVVFSVLTLPVEFNASRRALVQLRDGGYLKEDELSGARQVLSAAALTYVAATAMAAMQLLQLILLRGSRR
ncbi:MAG: zinc metallopeptidase [Candidatus Aminicenantes bacterium]|nr:MAG: zinc metallopeptidase [Candidatus Aminicenantes bacterium]